MDSINLYDWESSKNSKVKNIYSDADGVFECTLTNSDDFDDQSVVDKIHMMIICEEMKYSLLIQKSNNEPMIDAVDSNIEVIKSKFCSIFHDRTGNFWKYRNEFRKVPGHYSVALEELDSWSSSEEQHDVINRIKTIPELLSPERAFFNPDTNSIEKTYLYSFNGLRWNIMLPRIPREDLIISSLLTTRPSIVRIGISYEHSKIRIMCYGSGILISNRLVLTCAHNFDPIKWKNDKVFYENILVTFDDPACERLFNDPPDDTSLIEADIIRRGLKNDNVSDYDNIQSNATDLALLSLRKQPAHLKPNEYFNPQLNSLSCKSNNNPINSKLFLIGYNGASEPHDLNAYKYLEGFEHITTDKLNLHHHVNHISVSIGRLIKESEEHSQYYLHDCSTLTGSSGSVILDCHGKLAGIHIGVYSSRKTNINEMVFNKETYNKYVSIYSNQFQTFIQETILTNLDDDELMKKWSFNC